jgi:hypothetical protein
MTKLKTFAVMAALFLPLAVAGCSHPRPVVYAPPPPGLSALAQRGYYDGSLAARNDIRKGFATCNAIPSSAILRRRRRHSRSTGTSFAPVTSRRFVARRGPVTEAKPPRNDARGFMRRLSFP